MLAIMKREFIDVVKSIRSILILLFITFTAYQAASFLNNNLGMFRELLLEGVTESELYTLSVSFIVIAFGFLFGFTISHQAINKEMELKTIRLIVTKRSMKEIMIGKMLGHFAFWLLTITLSYLLIFMVTKSWSIHNYLSSVMIMFYVVNAAFLLSTLVKKSLATMFLGMFLGVVIPIIGMLSTASDKWYFLPFKYLLPFYYTDQHILMLLIPIVIAIGLFIIATVLMEKRDL